MRLGRIEISAGFVLLIAWMNYWDHQRLVPLALLAAFLHEAGHLAAIGAMGGKVRTFRLTAVGAEIQTARGLSYWQEGVIALAGPGINLIAALILSHLGVFDLFVGLNLVLGCFNLVPVGPLDGGRALRCTLALLLGVTCAEWVGMWLDRVFTFCSFVLGVFLAFLSGNITLLLVSCWLLGVGCSNKKNKIGGCHTRLKQVK